MLIVLTAIVALALVGFAWIERRRSAAEAALLSSELNLAQAQKLDAVGRLAGGLAHDINDYLAAIIAQCDLVARRARTQGDSAAAALYARMSGVIAIAGRAAGLIQRLLAFSRPQSPRTEVFALDGHETLVATTTPGIESLALTPPQCPSVGGLLPVEVPASEPVGLWLLIVSMLGFGMAIIKREDF